ncbi:MAG: hypothetical protein LUC33_00600, partial [Prevotellaceae bacterium]|nr:hypothetical protein [Prevotellaceae bacterium]
MRKGGLLERAREKMSAAAKAVSEKVLKKVGLKDFLTKKSEKGWVRYRYVYYKNGYGYATDGWQPIKFKADYPREWEGKAVLDSKVTDTGSTLGAGSMEDVLKKMLGGGGVRRVDPEGIRKSLAAIRSALYEGRKKNGHPLNRGSFQLVALESDAASAEGSKRNKRYITLSDEKLEAAMRLVDNAENAEMYTIPDGLAVTADGMMAVFMRVTPEREEAVWKDGRVYLNEKGRRDIEYSRNARLGKEKEAENPEEAERIRQQREELEKMLSEAGDLDSDPYFQIVEKEGEGPADTEGGDNGEPGGDVTAEGENAPYSKLLDMVRTLYKEGKQAAAKFARSYFNVVNTPDFMKELGLTGGKFTVRYGTVSRHVGKDAAYKLPIEVWEKLPEALTHPFAITRYNKAGEDKEEGKAKSFRIYTSIKTDNGYVVAGIDVKNTGEDLEVNSISTVFSKSTKTGEKEEILYKSPEITPEQTSLLGGHNFRQYPSEQGSSERKGKEKGNTAQENKEKKKRRMETEHPSMETITSLKKKHPGFIILNRSGSFDYWAYGEDARTLSEVLGLPLKRVTLDGGGEVEAVEFPNEKIDEYFRQIIESGHRFAVIEPKREPLGRKEPPLHYKMGLWSNLGNLRYYSEHKNVRTNETVRKGFRNGFTVEDIYDAKTGRLKSHTVFDQDGNEVGNTIWNDDGNINYESKGDEEFYYYDNGDDEGSQGDVGGKKKSEEKEPKPVGKGPYGDIYDQFKGKPKEAFDFLLKKRGGHLKGVFHRDEIGDIDLIWGDAPSDDRGKGLAHIIRKHVEAHTDFASEEEA